jgi:hypothetical protein
VTTRSKNAGRVFILRAIDPATASIAREARIEFADAEELCKLLKNDYHMKHRYPIPPLEDQPPCEPGLATT